MNDLIVDDPSAVVDYAVSFPPGEDADEGDQQRGDGGTEAEVPPGAPLDPVAHDPSFPRPSG